MLSYKRLITDRLVLSLFLSKLSQSIRVGVKLNYCALFLSFALQSYGIAQNCKMIESFEDALP